MRIIFQGVRGSNRGRIIGPSPSVEITYSVRDLRSSSVSHISLHPRSRSPPLLLLLLHPRDTLSFSAPNQVAPFFAASIKGQRGKTTSLCWSCGSMSRGLRTRMEGGIDREKEGERVTDCFDGQTLRFFPSPASSHSILLFAPEIRSHLFFFHRPSILP